MQKKRVFISSVQSEFVEERQMLFEYLTTDALLGKFFEPFVFENMPALAVAPETVFLQEVENCDIYMGLFGKNYGYEDSEGISPTEREFDCAVQFHKTKFVYLTNHSNTERNPKEVKLIQKAEKFVVRKKFESMLDLRVSVYNSLVRYLEENEIIRTLPFDATLNNYATWKDLDKEKIKNFLYIAHEKRAFRFTQSANPKMVLSHLNLVQGERITNAAILLFGKNPQKFFIASEVRCAMFPGDDVVKPITSYQVYKGDVFELVTQATQFVLSNIRSKTGVRDKGVEVDVEYELPIAAVTEAIVNAVAHRDYTSNASVQVMLFKDRLEVWNPGHLPYGMTVAKLKQYHSSIPVNPLLAEPMYLNGTIERVGTGTRDIVKLCKALGLKEPEYIQEEFFRTILWREYGKTDLKTDLKTDEIDNLILSLIKSDKFITIPDITQKIGKKLTATKDRLNKLKSRGLIERIGADKGGYWKVIDKTEN